MQRFVAGQNIHNFKELLARETDGARQRMLLRMIAAAVSLAAIGLMALAD